jgi:hypothetical protein
MLAWATKRKLFYFGIIVAFTIIFIVIPFYVFIYEAPTCFDGRRNGGEDGVDCGGACRLLCSALITEPIPTWDPRVFRVSPGVYSVLAYLENPNATGEVLLAPYTFRLYDKDSTLVAERSGQTFIPKGKAFAIFEGNIQTGERIPIRATFDFDRELVWITDLEPEPVLQVTNKALSREETTPRVDATVTNTGLERVAYIELVAIIFDASGNAIGSSRTFVESLEKGESKDIVFTWPMPFETKAEICATPVDVSLVLDRSGSMSFLGQDPPQPLTDVKNAAAFFVNQLTDKDQVAVVSFATTASTPADSPLTSDLEAVKRAIDGINIFPNETQHTNIGDGLKRGLEELNSERHNQSSGKYIVMLTDGVATRPTQGGDSAYPENYALQIANLAKTQNTGIFAIGLGKDINVPFLEKVASVPENAYQAPTAKELTGIYQEIATTICQKKSAVIEILHRFYPNRVF